MFFGRSGARVNLESCFSLLITCPAAETGYLKAQTVPEQSSIAYARLKFFVTAFPGEANDLTSLLAASKATGTAPAAPSSLSAIALSSNQIQLIWQDNSTNESSFKIERAPTSTGSWKQIATVGANVTIYTNAGLNASTTYYYRVRAYNQKGNSGYTAVAGATTLAVSTPCTVTISASASPSAGGSLTGGGPVSCNSSVTLTATSNIGYTFANWTEGGSVVSSSASYTFTASANRTLVANFVAAPTSSGITNNLTGCWAFDSASVSGTTALDSSGLGNHATLQGTTLPAIMPGKIA